MAEKKKKKNEFKLLPYEVEEVLTLQEVKQQAGWNITAFDLPKAWEKTQGEGVKIAVLDSVPGYSPIICKDVKTKKIMVLTIEEIFNLQNSDIIITEKEEQIKIVSDLLVWNGHSKNGKNWQKIKHVLRHSYKGIIKRLNLRGGLVDVTPNHSLIYANGQIADAKNVTVGQKLSFSGLKKFDLKDGLFFVGNCDLAWLMGFFAAEGSIYSTKDNPYVISLNQKLIEPLLKAQKICVDQLNVHSRIDHDADGYKLIICNRGLWNYISNNCVDQNKEKRVPNDIINSPQNIQLEFLKGYNLGDGYHKPCRLSWDFHNWTTKSQILACGLLLLNKLCLGQEYSIQTREDKSNIIQITLNQPNSKKEIKNRNEITKILDIDYDGFVYDLETEDHTFGCGVGPVRIHNTGCDLDHPDLVDNLLPGINLVKRGKPPEDDVQHGCVHPDTFIHTNFCGVEKIKVLYDRIQCPEILHNGAWIKDVKGFGLKTYSLNKATGNMVVGEIEYLHRTPVNGEIVDITLKGGINYVLTPWHPVYTKKRIKKNNYKINIVKASDLKLEDGFIIPTGDVCGNLVKDYFRAFGGEHKKCDRCDHVCLYFKNINSACKKCYSKKCSIFRNNYFLTEDWCYLIGLILTDGHINQNSNRIEITSTTPEILEKSTNLFKRLGFNPILDKPKNRSNRLIVNSVELVKLLLSIGLKSGCKSYNQELPEFVGKSPRSAICAFLAGVIDGDGCIGKTNKQNRITTVSEKFAYQLTYLLNSISIYASCVKLKNKEYKNKKINGIVPLYNCCFSAISTDISQFLAHPKKINRSKHQQIKKRLVRSISKIENKWFNGDFYDFTVKDYGTYIANGHVVSNTHVTGIICASNNDLGVVGVAPKAKVMPVKVLNHKGAGDLGIVSMGIRWAVDNGADILCMSLGSPNPVGVIRKACQYAESKGIPVFVAAGNAGKTKEIFYPAAYPETIAIGSIDENFDRSKFSNTGKALDFMAPGGKIFSTVPDNWYAYISGTSMACPFAAAVAALCLSYQRKHFPDKPLKGGNAYRELFKQHTTPISNADFAGKSFFQGFGIIDPRKFTTWLESKL